MRTLSMATFVLALLGAAAWLNSQEEESAENVVNVEIRDMRFNPVRVQVKRGQTVVWTNRDHHDHTVAADGDDNGRRAFQSGNLKTGESFRHQFNRTGSFTYACSYHPRMRGRVIVSE